MPRPLNVEKRKNDIARIAIGVLARGGPSALTIRAVAEELGGSVSKVTHIYPTRADLMRGTVELAIAADQQLQDEYLGKSPREALTDLLVSMMPLDESARRQERGRVALIGDRDQASARIFADGMERHAREGLTKVLAPLLDAADLDVAVDFCRTFVNGLTLSTTEHPDHWTADRQLAQVEFVVEHVLLPLTVRSAS